MLKINKFQLDNDVYEYCIAILLLAFLMCPRLSILKDQKFRIQIYECLRSYMIQKYLEYDFP